MIEFVDQMGKSVRISQTPKRIISLVPSQTELLEYLGLENEVVGITKFCIHPDQWFRSKTRVGGTKQLNFDKIRELKPDLIIGNKEENEKDQIEALMQEFPVWMSDIQTLDQSYNMIESIGAITKTESKAELLTTKIKTAFDGLSPLKQNQKVLYLIWKEPMMGVGHGTFIHHVLEKCGFENIFQASDGRYPEVSEDFLKNSIPDIVLLSSEPYPFKQAHISGFESTFPASKIRLADGEFFSWYGSRLAAAPVYFQSLIDSLNHHQKNISTD